MSELIYPTKNQLLLLCPKSHIPWYQLLAKKMAPCACTEIKCLIYLFLFILNLFRANGDLWLFEIQIYLF